MNRVLSIMVMLWCVLILQAQGGITDDIVDDLSDDYLRQNPDIEREAEAEKNKSDYTLYPYLNLDDNWINLNGADWTDLKQRFGCTDDTIMAIVHIGDSHIQAEGATSVTRRRLQARYGNAGRGLITPLRLAGTNQPYDYIINTTAKLTTAKLMKQPWTVDMGFTGISIQPKDQKYNITIGMRDDVMTDEYFDYIKMYCHGHVPDMVKVASPGVDHLRYTTEKVSDTLNIWLTEPVAQVTLTLQSKGSCDIFGFKLENSMMGLEYSAIGNNGATYSSYNQIGTLGADLRTLSPNLIIVSLGANEAFGKVSDTAMYNDIKLLVSDLRRHNPGAEILLTTPAECQRRTSKRRAKTKTYAVNTNIRRLRNVILRFGREHHIPTYDWYAVAGGDGASAKWLADGLLSNDRIHNTWKGYALQGDLLYDALINAVEK